MKFLVLFALVAAWISSTEAVACNDVASCSPNLSALQGDDPDIEEGCKAVRTALSCFRGAMDDCRKNPNIPKSTIDGLEAQLNTYDDMLTKQCGAPDEEDTSTSEGSSTVTASIAVIVLAVFGSLLL